MPLASAADTPNLVNTVNKDKFVNAVSNNANIDKSTTLNKEEITKLQKWAEEKKLDTSNNKELKLGSTGDQVKKLQTWLKENKFYAGNIDGNFGADTEKSVKAFQKEARLKEDGQVGDYTLMAMEQYDEYKATSTNTVNASSGEKKVYSSAKSSASYNNAKKTYSKYKRSNGWGYINGMDCWAMSDYLAGQYGSKGYQTRIRHAKTSYSNDHRWVQIYQNGQWVNAPDYSGLPNIYNPTGS